MNEKYHTLEEKPMQQLPVRELTVYSKHFDRALSPQGIVVPQIRLIGKWLDDSGFEVGRKFTVEHAGNKLILTLLEVPSGGCTDLKFVEEKES